MELDLREINVSVSNKESVHKLNTLMLTFAHLEKSCFY